MTEPIDALLAMQGGDLDVRSVAPSVALKDGSSELFAQVRERIVRPGGHYFFCKGLIGFPDLTRRCHLALCLFLEDDCISKLVEYPRKHLKTSIVTIGKTLKIFADRVIKGEDPIDRIGIGSSTKTNAMRFLRLIRLIPEQNILFQNFLPELMPNFSNEEVWNQEEIIFPRNRQFPDPSVDTLGAGGKPASRHYSLLIEDDMVNEENHDSVSAIRKAIELHQLWDNLLEAPNDPRITNENCWTDFDLNNHIVRNEPETAIFSVGATGGLNRKRSRHLSDKIIELTERWDGQESVWPERFDKAALARIRQKVGARIYNAQFENQPFDPEAVDFKEDWLRYFEWTHDRKIRVMPAGGGEMEVFPLDWLHIVAAFDPALGQKEANARSAFVIVGVDPRRRVFILETMARRDDPLKVLIEVFDLVRKWDPQRVGCEDVLFQKVLIGLLETRCRRWNAEHPEHPIYPGVFEGVKPARGRGKDARIRALIGTSFEQGQVFVHASQTDFIDEYLHFPIGETKDLLDAFAYTSLLWQPGTSDDVLEELAAQEDEWNAARDPITGY